MFAEDDEAPNTSFERRRRFVEELYSLGRALDSPNRYVVAQARKRLARLRRSLTDDRYAIHGYELLLPFDLPEQQEEHALLVAGVFALNPHTVSDPKARRTLCSALADSGSRDAAEARVRQLIAATQGDGLGYRLRQAVQLIGSTRPRIPLDYHALLNDLVSLNGDESRARKVRIRWSRDFQHRVHTR
ncbi:type I-E CRISPR-associated protein Cse2/CasB [Nocardiopsis aegyptia]|uniref:CRISPR system Cascade subunit CasB n=1 Tax=Nocardiopsis aegyptia TaxID=220378 RepID=A0A7Z0J8K0_9ACTN|nr:type I-E CRISPR-associated protein Cse2/CasB [Nocardiopsis aegyptia]NYJ32807.1 CRISPR system Cascade subunit CasB [Nocardiopsis aegyptia]